jgi:hypothetical protein
VYGERKIIAEDLEKVKQIFEDPDLSEEEKETRLLSQKEVVDRHKIRHQDAAMYTKWLTQKDDHRAEYLKGMRDARAQTSVIHAIW